MRSLGFAATALLCALALALTLSVQNLGKGGVFHSVLTQKLFIVPQANVLTGQGQEVKHLGKEDVAAEKQREASGASHIVSKAAKKAALEKKKNAARVQKQVAAGGGEEFGQSGMTLAELRAIHPFDDGRKGGIKSKMQELWNAAEESLESKDIKAGFDEKKRFGVTLKGAYQGYLSSKQRNYLPADAHGAKNRGDARRQASGAGHGQAAKARTQQLWDAAENDTSLASTRQKLGTSSHQKASRDLSGQPRNYLVGMDYHAPNYMAGRGW